MSFLVVAALAVALLVVAPIVAHLLRRGRTPERIFPPAALVARLEAHYFVNGAFLFDDELIENLQRIRHLPCTIVQGRYDIICPPVTADALARAWPEAEYIVTVDEMT